MVNMGVGEKNIVDIRCLHRDLLVLVEIRSLLHPAVHQDMLPAGFDHMAASGHFMVCSNKKKFHTQRPFLFFIVAPFPPDGYEYFTISRRSLCMIFFSSREI